MDEKLYAYYARNLEAKMIALAAQDVKLQTYGADGRHGHHFQLGACLSEEELGEFEKKYSITLPPDYRAFLKYVGNGGAGPGYRLTPLQLAMPAEKGKFGDEFLSTPFEYTKVLYLDEEITFDASEGDGYFHGALHLSHRGAAIFDFLIVSGPAAGQIWTDRINEEGDFRPEAVSFYSWYDRWLDESFLKLYSDKLKPSRYALFEPGSPERFEQFLALFRRMRSDQSPDGISADPSSYLSYFDEKARKHFRSPNEEERAAWQARFSKDNDQHWSEPCPEMPMDFEGMIHEFNQLRLRFETCDMLDDRLAKISFVNLSPAYFNPTSVLVMLEAFGFVITECGDGRGPYPYPRYMYWGV